MKMMEVIKAKIEKAKSLYPQIKTFPVRRIITLSMIAVLALSLPVTIFLTNQQQDLRQRASELTTIHHLAFEPRSIITPLEAKNVRLSVMAYNSQGQPITDDVLYEWGISSTDSIGTLGEISGAIATFIPQNLGTGDIFVTATNVDGVITQSIPVTVSLDGQPLPSTATPTSALTPTASPTSCAAPTITSFSDPKKKGVGPVSFSWNQVPGASEYTVQMADAKGWATKQTGSGLSFTGQDGAKDPNWRVFVSSGTCTPIPGPAKVLNP